MEVDVGQAREPAEARRDGAGHAVILKVQVREEGEVGDVRGDCTSEGQVAYADGGDSLPATAAGDTDPVVRANNHNNEPIENP